jgi:hypothetical protein
VSNERQQFEAYVMETYSLTAEQLRFGPKPYSDDAIATARLAWRAAYEAGEIAMKEKAANRAAEFYLAKGDALDIARAIRALAISGAEESTPDKTTSGGHHLGSQIRYAVRPDEFGCPGSFPPHSSKDWQEP